MRAVVASTRSVAAQVRPGTLASVMRTDCPDGTRASVAEIDADRPTVRPVGTAIESTGVVVVVVLPAVALAVVVVAVGVVVAVEVAVTVEVADGEGVVVVVRAAAGAAAAPVTNRTAVAAVPTAPRRSAEAARRRSDEDRAGCGMAEAVTVVECSVRF